MGAPVSRRREAGNARFWRKFPHPELPWNRPAGASMYEAGLSSRSLPFRFFAVGCPVALLLFALGVAACGAVPDRVRNRVGAAIYTSASRSASRSPVAVARLPGVGQASSVGFSGGGGSGSTGLFLGSMVAQRFVHFARHPQAMQQHRQFAGDRGHGDGPVPAVSHYT